MKPKTIKVLHWTVTGLFSVFMLMAGIVEFIQSEEGKEIMRHLGYPLHILIVLGAGKILGAIALLQTKFKTIKEWAYAGFTFNFIGACVARADAGDSTALIISPLLFLAGLLLSYFFWKKYATLKSK